MSSSAERSTAFAKLGFHFGHDSANLGIGRLPDNLLIVDEKLVFRTLRTVGIYVVEDRKLIVKLDIVVGKAPAQVFVRMRWRMSSRRFRTVCPELRFSTSQSMRSTASGPFSFIMENPVPLSWSVACMK